ncbi:hypothetical protein RRF57_000417 [Xylaria bambusicola]|uniref:Uncharacterized protein n=1 Tax=Xylaria bambusicola TaxID=326684 RepID=A0AAN7UCU1_9PEZI
MSLIVKLVIASLHQCDAVGPAEFLHKLAMQLFLPPLLLCIILLQFLLIDCGLAVAGNQPIIKVAFRAGIRLAGTCDDMGTLGLGSWKRSALPLHKSALGLLPYRYRATIAAILLEWSLSGHIKGTVSIYIRVGGLISLTQSCARSGVDGLGSKEAG